MQEGTSAWYSDPTMISFNKKEKLARQKKPTNYAKVNTNCDIKPSYY